MSQNSNAEFFKTTVLGHPSLLFVLFFTEMWERFSYYGMRAILVIFLTGLIIGDNPGWGWTSSEALSLLGTYAMFVYLTPLLGGWLADNKIGYRMAVVIGALFMTLGHASMAVETPTFLYIGITFLIIGNGFFKPNMTSIISKIYEGRDDKKDGAYNIFYMGVNAGAFIGIMLCGWIGEKIGWSYGFGLAGIFMFLGMLQFYYAQPLFGNIGDKPDKKKVNEIVIDKYYEFKRDKIFLDQAIKNLSNNPDRYSILFLKKIFSFYFVDFNSNYPSYYNPIHLFPILIISILSFPGFFIAMKKKNFQINYILIYVILNIIIFIIIDLE